MFAITRLCRAGGTAPPILLAVTVLAGISSHAVSLLLLNRKIVAEFWRCRALIRPRGVAVVEAGA